MARASARFLAARNKHRVAAAALPLRFSLCRCGHEPITSRKCSAGDAAKLSRNCSYDEAAGSQGKQWSDQTQTNTQSWQRPPGDCQSHAAHAWSAEWKAHTHALSGLNTTPSTTHSWLTNLGEFGPAIAPSAIVRTTRLARTFMKAASRWCTNGTS